MTLPTMTKKLFTVLIALMVSCTIHAQSRQHKQYQRKKKSHALSRKFKEDFNGRTLNRSSYLKGIMAAGLSGGVSSGAFNVYGTFQYYLSSVFSASVTTGYYRKSYRGNAGMMVPVYLEGNYELWNLKQTFHLFAIGGPFYMNHQVTGFEPSTSYEKHVYGAALGAEGDLIIAPALIAFANVRQNLVFNETDISTIIWSVGVKKKF